MLSVDYIYKDVLVTGANGFIGKNLLEYLSGKARCIGLIGNGVDELFVNNALVSKKKTASKYLNFSSNIEKYCMSHQFSSKGFNPEVIFHLAGSSSVGFSLNDPYSDYSKTVRSTLEILEWIRLNSLGTRLVLVSSAAVYGSGKQDRIFEVDSCDPFSPYGYHKLVAEILCDSYARNFGIKSVVARLFSVFGEGLRKQLLWDICTMYCNHPSFVELGGTGNELRDWVHVDDVVRALVHLNSECSVAVPRYNVCTGVSTSVQQIGELLLGELSHGSDHVSELRFSGVQRKGDPSSLVGDPGKLLSKGFDFHVNLAGGIRAYAQWFISQAGRL